MARALIVGCGCRGRALGRRLAEGGWAVRGTTRDSTRAASIEAAGIEPAIADPDRVITVLELVDDVAILCWLLGSARGDAAELEAIHGPRLRRLLEELVDTPLRGVAYEAAGAAPARALAAGQEALREANRRWRIPYALIEADPEDPEGWTAAAEAAVTGLVA